MKTVMFILFGLFFCPILFAQVSGNQVYRNKKSYQDNSSQPLANYRATDSSVTIFVNILLNQEADRFKLTLGVNEEAETSKKSLEVINNRIDGFSKKIAALGIRKEQVFVDFISQTKVYDFDIKSNENLATQKIKGFEIKKNIIIEFDDYSKFEKIIAEASEFQIFDIIKVDYINTDIEQIQQRLQAEANSILNKKKEIYFKKYNREIIGTPIANDDFYYVFPKTQYQSYTAFESADVDYMGGKSNSQGYIKKLERLGKTYYYEGYDYAGFDKVINNTNPIIGIQYVLNLTVRYEIKKNK